jgi:hypothetical protein
MRILMARPLARMRAKIPAYDDARGCPKDNKKKSA